MALAQMNWGTMRHPADDPRMAEFSDSLASVYAEAERHPGFIWRVPDAAAAAQLANLGFDARMSATVSTWTDVAALRDFTFNGSHGAYFARRSEWFEKIDGPQLVLWEVSDDAQPDFSEAFARLEDLKNFGPSKRAFGWPDET